MGNIPNLAKHRRRRKASDRRPVWLTKQMQEDLYMRWRDLMVAVARHDGLLIAHPKWQGFYTEMMERIAEDDFWITSIQLLPVQKPVMMFRIEIPEDELLVWTNDHKIQTPSEFFGNVGFGRMRFGAPTEQGPQPWGEMPKPKAKQPTIMPDGPDDVA